MADALTQGIRYRDMPRDWFDYDGVPADQFDGALAAARCNYLCDLGEMEQAREFAQLVIANSGNMLELHLLELHCEILFLELVGECRLTEVEKLYTDAVKAHMDTLKLLISTPRRQYAYELLYAKNEKAARIAKDNFEKICLHTPFIGEIAVERELLELVDRRVEQKKMQK